MITSIIFYLILLQPHNFSSQLLLNNVAHSLIPTIKSHIPKNHPFRPKTTQLKSAPASSETKPKIKKRRKSSIPIVACSSSIELHRAVDMYLKPDDTIIELGAQLSDVSAHICRKIRSSGHAVLVDIKRDKVSNSRCVGRNVDAFVENIANPAECSEESFTDVVDHYLEIDQLDQWRKILTLSPTNTNTFYNYNAMVLDVGTMTGNDLSMTALTIAQEFLGFQKYNNIDETRMPRVVLIKSKTLSTLARRLIHSQRLFDGTVLLPPKQDMIMQQQEQKQEHEPYIIASVGVEEYRRTIPFIVDKEDEILEVGCHFGRTTSMLHKKASCIGVDISDKIIRHAKKQYADVPFAVADAWRTLDLVKVKQELGTSDSKAFGYDLIYADIGKE